MNELNKQINDVFFKTLHKEQMSNINESIIEEAGTIILKLVEAISDNDLENYDELEIRALQWLKNNMK
jgi:Na+/pantothenate symporter